MRRFLRLLAVLALMPLVPASAEFLQLDQSALLYSYRPDNNYERGINYRSQRGVPGKAGAFDGADGRIGVQGSAGQFRGLLSFGGMARPQGTNLLPGKKFEENAVALNLPRSSVSNQVTLVLRASQMGAPYYSRAVSAVFGSVISLPATDEKGNALASPGSYWEAEPYTTNGNHLGKPYYWSPHARSVFATQPGSFAITWRKQNADPNLPGVEGKDKATIGGLTYLLTNVVQVVSGAAVKTPRKIYWTEKSFRSTGHAVEVPTALVGAVYFHYNTFFPATATNEFANIGDSSITDGSTNGVLKELRTIWYDNSQGLILAYNQEGRVFMELLGDPTGPNTRQHLGFEVVDVFKQPRAVDLQAELGEKITAYADGRDDQALQPAPGQSSISEQFLYQQNIGSTRTDYYAVKETKNPNDSLVHWLEAGVAGLRWPFLFDRYTQVWPADLRRYTHYLRPPAATPQEAMLTAVPLPNDNAPAIQYQEALDPVTRANLTDKFEFYTFLDAAHPFLRTLLRFNSGERVAFERVASSLSTALLRPGNANADVDTGTYVTNGVPAGPAQNYGKALVPRYVETTALVGSRIAAPLGETGGAAGEGYLAGYILRNASTADLYHPVAYKDPFAAGFEAAAQGAIIPVNAPPDGKPLEVWWFRRSQTNDVKNELNGFKPTYWPAVIARYRLAWPAATDSEIVLASNAGSRALPSPQAKGSIYTQNNPGLPGYNPNEEHALMLGGQAYALRDDLNITTTNGYSSAPYVLLDYTAEDGRPAMRAFKVLREKPEAGIVFDYIVEAGTRLQAPMPLPLLPPPVENGINYNVEPATGASDLPRKWQASDKNGPFGRYDSFTYKDRKENFWVLRGLHDGLPALQIGRFMHAQGADPEQWQTAHLEVDVKSGTAFTNYIHCSRLPGSLVTSLVGAQLPAGVSFGVLKDGLAVYGVAPNQQPTPNLFTLKVTDGDGAAATATMNLIVDGNVGGKVTGPLTLSYTTNRGKPITVTLHGRPPRLADAPVGTNSFTMRFYYKTQEGFAWPGLAQPPAVGSVVPFLRNPGDSSPDTSASKSAALDIVYRPVWPANAPKLAFGETLTVPNQGRPAIRGQTSAKILYQQAIATTTNSFLSEAAHAVVLHDPTRPKSFALRTDASGLGKLPDGVRTEAYQGKTYFPNLPPHLATRFLFDPNAGPAGSLVFTGEFKDEALGEKYLLLNVMTDTSDGSDLKTVKALCPKEDPNKTQWDAAIDGLATTVETFYENPSVPGQFVANPAWTITNGIGALTVITNDNTAVDSYALSAAGPGQGFVTLAVGDGTAFTPAGEPVSLLVLRVTGQLVAGEVKVLPSANPLNELITFQHTPDLGGQFGDYEYEWKIAPPVDGFPPVTDARMSRYQPLVLGNGVPRYTLGGSGVQVLADNYLVLRYRPKNPAHPLYSDQPANSATNWSAWTQPVLAEGWVKRVLAKINPFGQRVTDLYNNTVNTDASVLVQAGKRFEGAIALNMDTINNYGLIEIYETLLRRGRALSIDAGINFGPANDSLLLAAGYLNDLYMLVGNEAYADAANPTIGIGTKDSQYGEIATSLFAFKGQLPTLLDEELGLLRGRDDVALPGVETPPVYNRLVWNYTRGIDSGEVIYALNYNILDQNGDGVVDAADAARLFPQGHGDAYGHYLTAVKNYYSLLMNPSFEWVPRIEAVNILGKPVSVDYLDERKFAGAASAVARTGRQIFDLTWRQGYVPGQDLGWTRFSDKRISNRTVDDGGTTASIVRYWGADHWASRTMQGTFINWVVGNSILPDVDPDPTHEGIQKVDRTTVPELQELSATATDLQASLDNAEARLTPLGLPEGALAFDIDPTKVARSDADPQTHFEQVYARTKGALNNALAAFDDAKDVTRLMRSEQDSLAELQNSVAEQELSFTNALIEIYGTPYPDDVGPGKTYRQGYAGPDLVHYAYAEDAELNFGSVLNPNETQEVKIDIQDFPSGWLTSAHSGSANANDDSNFGFLQLNDTRSATNYITYSLAPAGFPKKPATWTGKRHSPGEIQQAISDVIKARSSLSDVLGDAEWRKNRLDGLIRVYKAGLQTSADIHKLENDLAIAEQVTANVERANEIFQLYQDALQGDLEGAIAISSNAVPNSVIVGLAAGGDISFGARAALSAAGFTIESVGTKLKVARETIVLALRAATDAAATGVEMNDIYPLEKTQERREALLELQAELDDLQGAPYAINAALQQYEDAKAKVAAVAAKGERLQQEREVARQRTAAVIQGFRTRDAAFRIFRNEKLERYKTLFDLAARYSFLAATAYDYETGLLNTDQGRAFVNRIVSSRALGVMRDGEPQFAGSNTGDPGLSSALAEMKADWDVLRGRLGFNSPNVSSTLASFRTENLRIVPGDAGLSAWQDYLQQHRMDNVLDDPDVRRYCLQAAQGQGLPVPGIVLSFSTTITPGVNLFGKALAAGDSSFHRSSFATKIHSVGVALPGYRGMNAPGNNNSAINYAIGSGTNRVEGDPSMAYLDPDSLASTPYIYLVPVGVDSMRSPPLGDTSEIRNWQVNDVAIPMPFNIGGSDFSAHPFYLASDSLSEPLFTIRKHQAFRPVDSVTPFANFTLDFSPYTNSRLIGRSVWNSQWKLIIPGDALLADPKEGLNRLIRTVTDIQLYFVTYSYAGN